MVGRHAFGDQYRATDIVVKEPGKLTLTFTPENGAPTQYEVFKFKGAGVALAMYNVDESIIGFAAPASIMGFRAVFPFITRPRTPFLRSTTVDSRDIFQSVYEGEFQEKYKAANLTYEHRLIDDVVAFAIKSEGGFVWLARITTVMCSLIWWRRALVRSGS